VGAGSELEFRSPPGELPDASVSNAELASMAAGTVKGRALGGGTGAPQDLNGVQLGELIRLGLAVTDNTSSGSVTTYTVAETTAAVIFNGSGTITLQGATIIAGKSVIWAVDQGSSVEVTFVNDGAPSITQERFRVPTSQNITIRSGESLVTTHFLNRHRVHSICKRVDAPLLAPVASNLAVPFNVYVSCPSGGAAGTADDVTIWNATAPFALRILDATLRVSTAVGGSTAALRTASGGGGSVVLPDPGAATQTFSTATTGPHDDVAVATATVASGGSLFLRRSDRSAVGELILTCIRT
jgi:hypothetical protein